MTDQSARGLALIALREWRDQKGLADSILGRVLRSSDLAERDRAFCTELFYGILRNITLLDFWVGSLRSEPLDDHARDLLRLGIYQLFLLDVPEHAAVNETVALARVRTRALINAVLRNAVRKKDDLLPAAGNQTLSVRSSHPQFLIDRWTQQFGPETAEALCEWNNRPAPIYARINQLKTSVPQFLLEHPDATPLPTLSDFVRVVSVPTNALANGHCYIQDPSTATACALLDPSPGETLLDACAAPGGKTAYLAQLMKNHGSIVACDREPGRIRTLQENLARLGVKIVQFERHDWTSKEPPPVALPPASFDRILVDAPCSNTGVMRRRADLRWRLTPKSFAQMQSEQLHILRATIPLLKPGGTFVYSTCSIEREENADVINLVLGEYPFLRLAKAVSLVPPRDGFDGAYAAKLIRTE